MSQKQDPIIEAIREAETELRRWLKPLSQQFETKVENWMSSVSAPALHLTANEHRFLVTAALPGVEVDDLHVEILDGQVTISGEHSPLPSDDIDQLRAKARDGGAWRRSIQLPPEQIEIAEATAVLSKGMLTVEIPRTSRPSVRHLTIEER